MENEAEKNIKHDMETGLGLLEGPWGPATTHDWGHNLLLGVTYPSPVVGIIWKVASPLINSY